ncbi:MAG: DUF4178 domain-containing protein [Acidobacteria bacterium]|nr:DUF4178 domain-containing protein [Acidobacteriota bacterium]
MSTMDKERFGLNQGRPRPPYQPQDIHCPGCGAGLTVKDEQARMVVCEYCGKHLDVSLEEKTVLGQGPERKWEFPLKIGDSFRYKGARYEIIARQAFIEDNDYTEVTREYLLYNPRRGTLYLSEYGGSYDLAWDTHVMPTTSPFNLSRGSTLETHDGRKWVALESGEYELAFVDGSLPWVAKVGDRSRYVDFADKGGANERFDVQWTANEVEYSSGISLTLEQVRQATSKPELGQGVVRRRSEDVVKTRRWYMILLLFCVAVLAFNGIMALYCMFSGRQVLEQTFTPAQLTEEVLSEPFPVSSDGNVIMVEATAISMTNAWMALDLALVKDAETVVHVFDEDIQYYQGSEGGESWSEGSREVTSYIEVPAAGNYRVLLHAVSAPGETPSATNAQHGVRIRVTDGVRLPHFYVVLTILTIIVFFISLVLYGNWRKQEE